jgi:hypothetical protein
MNSFKEFKKLNFAKSIVPKIRWETNSMVKTNPEIDKNKIIEKTSTYQFPEDAITIRVTSMRNKKFIGYFHGNAKKGRYCMPILKISVDCSSDKSTYSFTGIMPPELNLDEVTYALDYAEETLFAER